MKKLILILVLVLSFMSVSGKEISKDSFKTISINAKCTNSDWEGWQECENDILFDYDGGKIFIYSKTIQIFTFDRLEKIEFNNYYSFSGYVRDINNVKANVIIYFLKNGSIYLNFIYPQGEYIYTLKKTNKLK